MIKHESGGKKNYPPKPIKPKEPVVRRVVNEKVINFEEAWGKK